MAESVHCESGMDSRSDTEEMEWGGHVIDHRGEVIPVGACVKGERVSAPENVTKALSERSRLSETGISSVGCAAVMKAEVRLAAHRTTRCEFQYVFEHGGCKGQAHEGNLPARFRRIWLGRGRETGGSYRVLESTVRGSSR